MSERPVFLVSTGRTGTKFLANFFAEYGRDVSAYHCPRGSRLVHVLANCYERRWLPRSSMHWLWRTLRLAAA